MSILILSFPKDFHASVVEWCIREIYGHRGIATLFTSDYSNTAAASMRFDGGHEPKLMFAENALSDARVVWRRRIVTQPPNDDVHADDREFIDRENRRFLEGFWSCVGPDAFWINPHDKGVRASSKPIQLKVAGDVGLRIPTTLFSNCPREIRSFVKSVGRCIYKPFNPIVWKDQSGSTFSAMTTKIAESNLHDGQQLQNCAGIFQEEIEKQFELRVTIFGKYCVAVKIDSQTTSKTKTDWRHGFNSVLSISKYELPSHVLDRCYCLMDQLGLVFGTIDLAVTPGGDFVFFEINEMGQFLWVDDYNTEINTLAPFCEFLLSGSKDFQYKSNRNDVLLKTVRENPQFLEFLNDREVGHATYLPGFFRNEKL